MKKTLVLSTLLALAAMGAACGDNTANNTAKNATTNANATMYAKHCCERVRASFKFAKS